MKQTPQNKNKNSPVTVSVHVLQSTSFAKQQHMGKENNVCQAASCKTVTSS